MRKAIQPIVEGHGEVEAVPLLLRRLLHEAGVYDLDVNPPHRKHRSDFVREAAFRAAVRVALLEPECSAVLILFDADDDCPKDLAPRLEAWALEEAHGTPCGVVVANREYESWFAASLESLRGRRGISTEAVSHPSPESLKNAKGHIEQWMRSGAYKERTDQPALTNAFDLSVAYRRCRSFRRLVKVVGALAGGAGVPLAEWPPPAWIQQP
jgi:hypothetical protein